MGNVGKTYLKCWVKNLVVSDKIMKIVKMSGKNDILTVEEKEQAHKVNNKKITIRRSLW